MKVFEIILVFWASTGVVHNVTAGSCGYCLRRIRKNYGPASLHCRCKRSHGNCSVLILILLNRRGTYRWRQGVTWTSG